jgi:hypothetical protein
MTLWPGAARTPIKRKYAQPHFKTNSSIAAKRGSITIKGIKKGF